jgi:hypothetical protein
LIPINALFFTLLYQFQFRAIVDDTYRSARAALFPSLCEAEPRLVCEIEFRDWTHDGLIRQASFKGRREDKPPEDISLEMPKRSKLRTDTDVAGVGLTHPERILWAEPGITKQGLADFYADVADWNAFRVTKVHASRFGATASM